MINSEFEAICFIFARGGSKGLPRKNIRLLAGKPLIAYSIEIALTNPRIKTTIVSTDDHSIAEVALSYGAEVPFLRPQELASDSAPEWLAWRHAVEWYRSERGEFDIFLSLPPTSPFRQQADVDACLDLLTRDPNADGVITVRAAERSPYFNMITLDKNSYANLVIPPAENICHRQDTPEVFDITTVAYAMRPTFILECTGLFDGNLRTVCVPTPRAIDIDTPFDFKIAEALAGPLASNSYN